MALHLRYRIGQQRKTPMTFTMQSAIPDKVSQPRVERRPRTLLDELLAAFHFACDIKDYEIAKRLLETAETTSALRDSAGVERRRGLSAVVAAHERLWALSHVDH
jgi:hypothetical protein